MLFKPRDPDAWLMLGVILFAAGMILLVAIVAVMHVLPLFGDA